MANELKTSNEWYSIIYPDKEVVIMDPDGWDRQNFHFSWYEQEITREEFIIRVMNSTVRISKGYKFHT